MSPTARILANLGIGPRTEMALIAVFIAQGFTYEKAQLTVTNALCDLLQSKRIEMPITNVYRLTAGMAPMEGGK